ncbi:helix-turn-helix transcriptional regulator [Thermomicrobiaceae bacterium CFH 74404]|uniref:Helix-turn-helix transcriptional regulator n=1 Tax=Thermalbibacter longus TaxID=2951981 RepID=A0AA41WDG2_9BACT|nr:helix-turn-helix transcriptional regulator [Thermalbibacter longus]MCM8748025.1 helix-turn-helix transcriptional regulator [Thermalbibacter longus]
MSENETPVLIPAEQVPERALARSPELRARWEATALARAVALWLVQRRAELGLSQAALARRLGVSQPTVARWESGEHVPELTTLLRLADQLGLRLHLDIEAPGERVAEPSTVEKVTTEHGSRLRVALSTA